MTTRRPAVAALASFVAMGFPVLAAHAQDAGMVARVISSTPVTQTVAVPRQVCSNQPVVVGQPSSGAGSVIGAIAGGVVGSTIGRGNGNALATAVGVVGGAMAGANAEANANPSVVQNVQHCQTQTFQEQRVTGYNVVYEYQGAQYASFMQQDPGSTVQLQLSPVGASAPMPMGGAPVASSPETAVLGTPVVPPVQSVTTVVPAPVVVNPYPVYTAPYAVPYPVYTPRYVAPVISLRYGWRPHHHYRRWR